MENAAEIRTSAYFTQFLVMFIRFGLFCGRKCKYYDVRVRSDTRFISENTDIDF